jgi:hypothetical protein
MISHFGFFRVEKVVGAACHAKKKLPHKKIKRNDMEKTTLGQWITHCGASSRNARKKIRHFRSPLILIVISLWWWGFFFFARDSARDILPCARRIPQQHQRQEGCKN